MHNYKKINYSKRAIKTEKGWFAGWDQFGRAKFMESVELAELSSPQMAEVTASKLEKEGMETELATVYVENDAIAVKWDELEVVVDLVSGLEQLRSEKRVFEKTVGESAILRWKIKKFPNLISWLRDQDSPMFVQFLVDDLVISEAAQATERCVLDSTRLEMQQAYWLAYKAMQIQRMARRGMALANNRSQLELYGRETVSRMFDVIRESADGTIEMDTLFPSSFAYNTKISIPQLLFSGANVYLSVPDAWRRQVQKEKIRSSGEYQEP